MDKNQYSNAALVLLGHGSSTHEGSKGTIVRHAEALRRRGLFAEVYEAFWKGSPSVVEVLERIEMARIFIVPMFLSWGFFSGDRIPQSLGFGSELPGARTLTRRRGGQTLFYGEPIGTDPAMTAVIASRAEAALREYPFPRAPRRLDTALFILGHGTPRSANSRQSVEERAAELRAGGTWGEAHAVFLEEEPRLDSCYARTSLKNIVVVPYLMGEGPHSTRDVPRLLGLPETQIERRIEAGRPAWRNPTERNGKRVWITGVVGGDPLVAEIIVARVNAAANLSEPA